MTGREPAVHPEHLKQPDANSPAAAEPRPLTDALRKLARAMPERGRGGLDEKVRAVLTDLPMVLGYHTWDSRRSPEGFPDWVLCGPSGVLYRELKREGKDPTPKQQAWLDALTAAGCDAGVWRPSDYYAGRVATELAVIATRSRVTITEVPDGQR